MYREGVDLGHIGKERRVAIALMHIQIHDADALNPARLLQHADGHRHIVEHAEALAMARHGMVGAARQIRCNAVFECHHGRVEGALYGHSRAIDEPLRPGQSHAAFGAIGEHARRQCV